MKMCSRLNNQISQIFGTSISIMVLLEMNANYVSFVGSCVWVGQHAAKRLRLQHLASVQAIPLLSKCVSTGFERTDALLRLLYVWRFMSM